MKNLKQKLVENAVGTIFLRPSVVWRASIKRADEQIKVNFKISSLFFTQTD